jgi:nucleotidyltransferase substrate binding protein (TIGR01987 family)
MTKISLQSSSSFENLKKSFQNLTRSLSTPVTEPRDLSGIIKDFEMVYELSWKVLKKKILEDGHQSLGAKDVFTKAYQLGYLGEQDVWLEMIVDRNQAAHVYDEKMASQIVERIRNKYAPLFAANFLLE